MAEAQLELKIGASVMLVRNYAAHQLVNGSMGIVRDFRAIPPPSDDQHGIVNVIKAGDKRTDVETPARLKERIDQLPPNERLWPLVYFPSQDIEVLVSPVDFCSESRYTHSY